MKYMEEQIAQYLTAFSLHIVLDGIDLWASMEFYESTKEEQNNKIKEIMNGKGWFFVSERPTDKEYLYIKGMYFVQDRKEHNKRINREMVRKLGEKKERDSSNQQAQKAMVGGIKQTEILCPYCKNLMYKEPVCSSCKEGRQGYKIRLMCEDNPDHEVLL